MITRKDLSDIYIWAKYTKFPLKKAPTSNGYCNKEIYISWLKGAGKRVMIRKRLMPQNIVDIFEREEIIYATYSIFSPGTILNPHRDPDVYPEKYKRIQVPLSIPHPHHCFMIWDDKKVVWKEGQAQVYPVMDVTHEGYNLTQRPMEFIMIDVKKDTVVEIG